MGNEFNIHEFNIHEDLLGLIPFPGIKAQTIFKQINDVLIKFTLSIYNCRGQAYDGASNLSGIYNGIEALVKKEEIK